MHALIVIALLGAAEAKKPKAPPEPAPPPAEFTLPCSYGEGTSHTYRVESATIDRKEGQPEDQTAYRTDYTIRVASWDGATVTSLLTAGTAQVLDPPADPLMARVVAEAAGIRLDKPARLAYAHAEGQARLVNVDEMAEEYAAAGAKARPLLEGHLTALPPETAAGILRWYDAYVTNPVVVSKPFLEIGQPLFAYTCLTLAPGAYPYETGLPNAFGGDLLPAKGTLEVGAPQGDRVRFVDSVVLDPVAAMAILRPMFVGMGLDVPEGAGLESMAIDLRTRLELDVSTADGWPVGWTNEQHLSAGGTLKVIRTVVTRIE